MSEDVVWVILRDESPMSCFPLGPYVVARRTKNGYVHLQGRERPVRSRLTWRSEQEALAVTKELLEGLRKDADVGLKIVEQMMRRARWRQA